MRTILIFIGAMFLSTLILTGIMVVGAIFKINLAASVLMVVITELIFNKYKKRND